jgi:hypothetical protein
LSELLYALPIAIFVLCLFYYWFAIADRYFVFLYEHDMGPRYPDTSPFSNVTSSRYWMAGLVVAGAVMVLYVLANWLLDRIFNDSRSPDWWRVWVGSAVPLIVGIPAITMTVNQPTMPFVTAAQITLATLIGLGIALPPGQLAAERPGILFLLAIDGLALMFVLLNTPALEDVGRWWASGRMWYLWMMAAGYVVGVILLLIVTILHFWLRTAIPRAVEVFVAGLCVAYLLMPLLHHISFSDGYYYITNKDNFFSRSSVFLQIVTWLLAGGIAWGITWLRKYLAVLRPVNDEVLGNRG